MEENCPTNYHGAENKAGAAEPRAPEPAMNSDWRYDGSVLDYETFGEHEQELYLARLTVKDDGTAELLFPSGARKQFPTEEDASLWLGDEEFRRLEDLM